MLLMEADTMEIKHVYHSCGEVILDNAVWNTLQV